MEFKDGGTEWREGFYLLVWNENYTGGRSPEEIAEKNAGALREMGLNVEYELGEYAVEYDMSCTDEQLFKDALTIITGLRGDVLGDIVLMVIDGHEVRNPIWEETDLYIMESLPVAAQKKDRFNLEEIDLEIIDNVSIAEGDFNIAVTQLKGYKKSYYETGEELGYGREIIDQLWARVMNDFNKAVSE